MSVELRPPFFLKQLNKQATEQTAKEIGLTPGGFIFGLILFKELKGKTPEKATDFVETVGTIGEIPFIAPEWQEGLVHDLEAVIESVRGQSGSSMTTGKIASLLAQGLNEGYLSDFDRLGRQLVGDEIARFDRQNAIYQKLNSIAQVSTSEE